MVSVSPRAQQVLDDGIMLARLTRDLPRYLRRPMTVAVASERVRRGLAGQEQRLLTLLEQHIYGNPDSPFAALLRAAGCEPGDAERLVAREGAEGALRTLADRGVYLTFDEVKGRTDAVRGSQRFSFQEEQFDNTLVSPHFAVYTSGSRGQPSRVLRSLSYMAESAACMAVGFEANGLRDLRHVYWLTAPVGKMMAHSKLRQPCAGWFYPTTMLRRVQLGARYLGLLGRAGGYQFPQPQSLDLHAAERLVTWLRRLPATGQPTMITTTVSSAVRLAIAARAANFSLNGVTFYAQGEPMSPARRAHIDASGAKTIVDYGTIEIMGIGYGCPSSTAADDVHIFTDRHIVTSRTREVAGTGTTVDALLFTTLNPAAPRIMLNVENGDCATVETRSCDCLMGQLGLQTHLSDIRSFEKLTGEGMTVVRSTLEHLLEQQLPQRFGGTSLDYQLVEQEATDTATLLVLRVHPSVGPLDEAAVQTFVLEQMARDSILNTFMTDMWRRAGTITVSRDVPLATTAGKVLPFHLARRGSDT